MKKPILLIIFTFIIFTVAGCSPVPKWLNDMTIHGIINPYYSSFASENPTLIHGIYVEENTYLSGVFVYDDGTCFFSYTEGYSPGTYEIHGNTLIFTANDKNQYAFDIIGDSLVYNEYMSSVLHEESAIDYLKNGLVFVLS